MKVNMLLAGAVMAMLASLTAGCSSATKTVASSQSTLSAPSDGIYRVGPGDQLSIFVWRNPDFSMAVTVRPDGRISMPLVDDLLVVGQTPRQLADEIEMRLSTYVKDPIVTVIVEGFVGTNSQQIRVVGEAAQPQAIPFYEGMTALDVLISVGGLTEFAAGNRATLVRTENGAQKKYRIRLDDLIKRGDISANTAMKGGDIIIIPESWL